jgi:hypothetical protein
LLLLSLRSAGEFEEVLLTIDPTTSMRRKGSWFRFVNKAFCFGIEPDLSAEYVPHILVVRWSESRNRYFILRLEAMKNVNSSEEPNTFKR